MVLPPYLLVSLLYHIRPLCTGVFSVFQNYLLDRVCKISDSLPEDEEIKITDEVWKEIEKLLDMIGEEFYRRFTGTLLILKPNEAFVTGKVKGEKMDNSISKIQGAITRNSELFEELASLYKIFGDASRVKILCALTQSEMNVSEISAFLDITQSAVSHQLRVLKTSGLIKSRRKGKTMIYSLADEHVRTIIDCGMEHIG